ncbi:MAG TPA: hypothetical protein VJC04_00145 [Candidatus Paceibacterota bacterium]
MPEKILPKITLYGFGYVGRAVFNFLKDKYHIQIVDPKPAEPISEEVRKLIITPGKQKPTVYAVVAVPTSSKKDGSCDTSRYFLGRIGDKKFQTPTLSYKINDCPRNH